MGLLQTPAAVFDHQGMIRHLNSSWAARNSIPVSTVNQLVDLRDRANMIALVTAQSEANEPRSYQMRLPDGLEACICVQRIQTEPGLWLAIAYDLPQP